MTELTRSCQREESGFILVATVMMLLPLIVVVGAFMSSMTGRNVRLREEVVHEKALQAAEAGLNAAIYRAKLGVLVSGTIFARSFGQGLAYSVEPTYLGGDGLDNDTDGNTDEADEDLFQVIIRGTYRGYTRRIAAYLGAKPIMPTVDGAVTINNPNIALTVTGSARIDGANTDINGSTGDPTKDQPGLTTAPPGTVADLLGELDASEQARVDGLGGAPSLDAAASSYDLTALVNGARHTATVVLMLSYYTKLMFGDARIPTAEITYRDGDVMIDGKSRGAGLMVVTGDLSIAGQFRFDGVIVVLGSLISSAGTADIYGAVIQGPGSPKLRLEGNVNIQYSREAIKIAADTLGTSYVAFNGWQELSRN